MFENLNASRKILLAFLSVGGLTAAAGAMMVWSLFSLSASGERIGARLAPLVDAAMEIKLHAAEAHLVMEEIMAGDGAEDISEVMEALDEARFYATAILDGGENDEGRFVATDDPEVRATVNQVLIGVDEFARAVNGRYGLLAVDSGVGSEADVEFDALYDDLTDRIAAATEGSASADVQRLAGDARYLLAHGHVLVAEILGGDLGEDFGEATGSFEAAMDRLGEAAALSPPLAADLTKIRSDIVRLRDLALVRYDRTIERDRARTDAEVAFDNGYAGFVTLADEAESAIQELMAVGLASQKKASRSSLYMAIAAALVLLVLMIVFQRWLDRSLGQKMKSIAASMEQITSGDLEGSLPDWGTRDEIGLLCGKLRDLRTAFIEQRRLERTVHEDLELAQRRQAEAERLHAEADRERVEADRHREIAEARARAADIFGREFARVAAAAREGRFDLRIEARTGAEDLDRLGVALNEMLSTVNDGVGATIRIMSAVANGDLRKKMEGGFKGAFGDMQACVNETLDALTRITASMSETSRDLAAEVGQLAESSERLSQRSTSQAASLEETNAAITSMLAMVKSTEADCSATVERVSRASEHAKAGEEVVLSAISAVEKIDENARKVSEFITVIDQISFQTNLLALNAGVEAARAGEAGKGFAVVAQEVRALAQRANEAASGMGGLIEESGRGVTEGVRLVTQTGEVLREILASISEVAAFSEKIGEASREQTNGIAEVSTVISDLDRLTQQNAAMAEEGRSLSKKLRDRSEGLEMLIDFFSTDTSRPAGKTRQAS